MKGIISIFSMPQELEDLAQTLERLKRNSVYVVDKFEYKVEVTMCLSNELTDWENSKLPKEYFEERAKELCEKYLDWCSYECVIEETSKVLGCVSQRRYSLKNNSDADFFIWLDSDILFKDITLYYISSAYEMIKSSGIDDFVVTPQFVKQWDNTWDIVANKNYLNKPLNYHLQSDIYQDSLPQLEDIEVKEINNFKFAGGWFTLLSKSLLDKTDVPESFGHYGLEDTYIMWCCELMKQKGKIVSQFVLENLIVGETHKNRTNNTIKKFIVSKDKKLEFKKVAEDNFEKELNLFNNR